MTLVEGVAARLARLVSPGTTCLVAVSGGPDSMALLDLLHRGASDHGRSLVVGHVDHGIDPSSDVPMRLARDAAIQRGLPFVARRCALGAGTSETTARVARRRALRALAREAGAGAIVVAHHADDQAETVLLRVIRGSGPAGLAAMSSRRGVWIRPLLSVRRADLHAHLAHHGIEAWNDPSNHDPIHLRSWLRHDVLPVLAARLPDVVPRLLDAQRHARRAREAATAMPALVDALMLHEGNGVISVAAPALRGYRSPVRDAILAALGRLAGVMLGERRLRAISALLASASGSGCIRVSRRVEVELAFDRLTFHQAVGCAFPAQQLDGAGEVAAGRFRFAVRRASAPDTLARDGWSTALPIGDFTVRPWAPGDRIRPLGGTGSRAVATLLREARVAPHRRDAWPVVLSTVDATIVWVPGICRSEAMIPQRGTEGLHVDCTDA